MRVLIHHLGLGDGIVLAGAAVKLAQDEPLIFPCLIRHLPSFIELFYHAHHAHTVIVTPIKEQGDMYLFKGRRLLTGYYAGPHLPENIGFDQWFYDQLGIPIQEKWDSFPFKEWNLEPIPGQTPYSFVHHDPERGYGIDWDRLPDGWRVAFPLKLDTTILENTGLIYNADRLDLINSAILHMCDQMPLRPEQPKFLHRYARPWRRIDMPTLRHKWTILD